MRHSPADPATARTLKAALESLSTGRDPVLRDLAAGLLDGRLSLADLTAGEEALPVFQQAIERYAAWRASLSEEEFARLADEAQQTIARLRHRIATDGEGRARAL